MAPLGFTQCIYPANSIILPCETGLRRDSNQRKQTAGVSLSLFCCSCSGTLSLLRFTLIITRCVPEMANLSHKVLHKTTGLKLISLWPLQNLPSFFSFLPGTSNCVRQDKWNVVVVLLFFIAEPRRVFQPSPASVGCQRLCLHAAGQALLLQTPWLCVLWCHAAAGVWLGVCSGYW